MPNQENKLEMCYAAVFLLSEFVLASYLAGLIKSFGKNRPNNDNLKF